MADSAYYIVRQQDLRKYPNTFVALCLCAFLVLPACSSTSKVDNAAQISVENISEAIFRYFITNNQHHKVLFVALPNEQDPPETMLAQLRILRQHIYKYSESKITDNTAQEVIHKFSNLQGVQVTVDKIKWNEDLTRATAEVEEYSYFLSGGTYTYELECTNKTWIVEKVKRGVQY